MVDFLLEIGTEDMPYNHVRDGIAQLADSVKKLLDERKIGYQEVKGIGTSRRLAVYVRDIALEETPEEEVIIGPPLQIALDKDGKPTQALIGFLKAKNASLNDVEYLDTEKGTYISLRKKSAARKTKEILEEKIPEIILSLSFPKTMRWEGGVRFTRPIRNLLCIIGEETVNFSIANVFSSRFTFGHRIWGKEKIHVHLPEEYFQKLKESYVIVEPEERKKIILNEIERIEKERGGKAIVDNEVIEYWVYTVEHPFLYVGSFDPAHVNLPSEVIGYVIEKNQKFFPLLKEDGTYLPYFIGVADSADDLKGYIAKGAERVINARLIDAKFFWEKDRETPFEAKWQDLSKIIYHEKLGTYMDKSQRINELSIFLANEIGLTDIDSIRMASQYCKVDLVTQMVKEFPALQGVMGGLYLREEGYPENVWRAVYEHYKPLSLEDSPPSSIEEAILSIADKIDHIVGAFGIGIEFSGSSDPFALRKAGFGLCKTIIHHKISTSINKIVEISIQIFNNLITEDPSEVKEKVLQFIDERLEYIFHDWMGFPYDHVKAVFASGTENIYNLYLKLKALEKIRETELLKSLVFVHKRIKNIVAGQPFAILDETLLIQKEEKELWEIYKELERDANNFFKDGNFEAILELLLQVEPFINRFFDKVLVMVEDMDVRKNRISLLTSVNSLLQMVADFSQIVV